MIRLGITKPNYRGKQKLMLTCSPKEAFSIYNVLKDEIDPYQRRPVIHKTSTGDFKFYFKVAYLDKLVMTFPKLEISGRLGRWIQANEKPYEEEFEVPVNLDIPGFKGKLYDFQEVAVNAIVKNKVFWENDEMGLGKTAISLAAMCKLEPWPALAIVPNSVKYTWAEQARKFTDIHVQVVDGNAAERTEQIYADADLTVINYEATWRHEEQLAEIEWGMVVLDEFHRIKSPYTKQTKAVMQIQAPRKLLLSGTPVLNGRLQELWAPLKYCWPDNWPNYHAFEQNHCIKQGYSIIAYKNVYRVKKYLQGKTIRRRKEHVLDSLPEVIYSTRYVDLSIEQRKLYNQIRDELLLWLEDGSKKTIKNVLVKAIRLKQACFSPELYGGSKTSSKIAEMKDLVEELTDSGEKVIIFSQWSKATNIIKRELEKEGYDLAYVDGSVKTKERMVQIKKFQEEDSCRVYVGTIGANKEGITLSKATYVIFMDKGWTPAENDQAAARSAAGGLRGIDVPEGTKINIIDIQAKNTIEEHIEQLLASKQDFFNKLFEKDGGRKVDRVTIKSIKELLQAA